MNIQVVTQFVQICLDCNQMLTFHHYVWKISPRHKSSPQTAAPHVGFEITLLIVCFVPNAIGYHQVERQHLGDFSNTESPQEIWPQIFVGRQLMISSDFFWSKELRSTWWELAGGWDRSTHTGTKTATSMKVESQEIGSRFVVSVYSIGKSSTRKVSVYWDVTTYTLKCQKL